MNHKYLTAMKPIVFINLSMGTMNGAATVNPIKPIQERIAVLDCAFRQMLEDLGQSIPPELEGTCNGP